MDEFFSPVSLKNDGQVFASSNDAPRLQPEAEIFIQRFIEPDNPYQSIWKPRYWDTLTTVSSAIEEGRTAEIVDLVWSEKDNNVCNVGKGGLGAASVNALREDFEALTLKIVADGSPESFQSVIRQLTEWRDERRISKLPKLLTARAFATLHPKVYHTLAEAAMQEKVIAWMSKYTGFSAPEGNWAHRAQALARHLTAIASFDEAGLERNMFPWFVYEQLRGENFLATFKPGHRERAHSAYANVPATLRKILLRHNQLQTCLYHQLCEQYGDTKVKTEQATGSGGFADALVRVSDTRCFLYEVKVCSTAASAVREALGQLLEYAYRPMGLEPEKLFIVAEPVLDADTGQFLKRLNTEFGLKLEYLQLTLPDNNSIDNNELRGC
ncbi:hypothetical protein HX792_18900 [Pseudomonas sp. B6002]|uniref:hypothetical protein n=1 Tax=Pseudomonas sp. B6002 TaxID=2726978 RepID=UPI00159FE3D0|nr:hypothetical protein [Pseudomonas sp. B6002]NVZ52420.1 hypothetical protein [Pseudomonas sp. B6002]